MSRSSKALNELYVYTQKQLEKLHFTYERLDLNDFFQQMNEPYLQNWAPSGVIQKVRNAKKQQFYPHPPL